MELTVFSILCCVTAVHASLVPSHRISRRSVSEREAGAIRLPGTTAVQVEIALAPSNTEAPENILLSVSDPNSPEYGKHWTAQEVALHFAPKPEDVSDVKQWLENTLGANSARLPRLSRSGGHIVLDLTVSDVEALFDTTCYSRSTNNANDERWLDCGSYTLPEKLQAAVEYIAVTEKADLVSTAETKTPLAKRSLLDTEEVVLPDVPLTGGSSSRLSSVSSSSFDTVCATYSTPACLRQFYNIPEIGVPHADNSFGIYMQAYMTWLADDLDRFFDLLAPERVGDRPIVEPINGGYQQWDYNITPFNLEPNLDFSYTISLTGGLPVTNLQVGDENRAGNVNTMLAAFDEYYCGSIDPAYDPVWPDTSPGGYNASDCGTVTPPKVISISFAWIEGDYSQEYLERQCLEILKLGLMGVTVVVSSGDSGAQAGIFPGTCIDPETGATDAPTGAFSPTWPASCPWITTVGGTSRSTSNCTSGHWEKAFRLEDGDAVVTSGGGFSRAFPAPEYQKGAVEAYATLEADHLEGLAAEAYLPDANGRGFPDVSVIAERYLIYLYGRLTAIHGTSGSAPVFASMIALINNERLEAGKGPVGFVNPAMYAHPDAFNDIVRGTNEGCGASVAYKAIKGWDPVTGLGSPDYERLRDVLVKLP